MAFEVINFGCRLNSYESEIIKEFLKNDIEYKDKEIVIFNSCCVTQEAERQLIQNIKKVRKEKKNALLGVVGCAVQVNKDKYLNMPEVDFVFGNNDKMDFGNYSNIKEKTSVVSDVHKINRLSGKLVSGFEGKVRAFIQIQNGCDNHCTFCLTRLARGYSISTPSGKIVEQVNKLVDNGYKEIVLTGVDISDYGKRLDEDINLGKLIKKILNETSIERLRISSIDISQLNQDLIDVLCYEKRLMPHIHLSLQSGDNTILRKMARRNTREEVIEKCHLLKSSRPEIIFGADMIAGFPTETEEMHKNSLKIIQEIPITFGHIFPYSVRPETVAGKMPQVDMHIRRERAKELRAEAEKNLNDLKNSLKGTTQKVLIENAHTGRLENYLQVELDGDYSDFVNKIIDIKL